MSRNDHWLSKKLEEVWQKHFADISEVNPINIKFSRRSKFRFGSIRLIKKRKLFKVETESKILINGMFRSPAVPEPVIEYTIAHELTHYVHGFSSNLPQQYRHPHHGGVVNKELVSRGLSLQVKAYKIWLRDYRRYIKNQYI